MKEIFNCEQLTFPFGIFVHVKRNTSKFFY